MYPLGHYVGEVVHRHRQHLRFHGPHRRRPRLCACNAFNDREW